MHMYIRKYSKRVVKEEQERVKKKGEKERVYARARKRKDACERASGNAHYAFLRIVTSIRTTPFVFCFFVCLFSFVFNYQFSFTLLSLSRHILRTR